MEPPYPNTKTHCRTAVPPVPECKDPGRRMVSSIDEAWDDLKNSETTKTRAHASRVSRILNGSSGQVKSRSVRGNRRGIQRKHRAEGLSFADLADPESKVFGSPAVAFYQGGGASLRKPPGEEIDESLKSTGVRINDRRKYYETRKKFVRRKDIIHS